MERSIFGKFSQVFGEMAEFSLHRDLQTELNVFLLRMLGCADIQYNIHIYTYIYIYIQPNCLHDTSSICVEKLDRFARREAGVNADDTQEDGDGTRSHSHSRGGGGGGSRSEGGGQQSGAGLVGSGDGGGEGVNPDDDEWVTVGSNR